MLFPRARRNARSSLLVAFLFATMFHLLLIFTPILSILSEKLSKILPATELVRPTEVGMVKLARQDWDSNLALDPHRTKPALLPAPSLTRHTAPIPGPEPPASTPPPATALKAQVVDAPTSPDRRPPENARLLSERNNRVEKESVSRSRSAEYDGSQPRPPRPAPAEAPVLPGQPSPGKDERTASMQKHGNREPTDRGRSAAAETPRMGPEPPKVKSPLGEGGIPTASADARRKTDADSLGFHMKQLEPALGDLGDNGRDDATVAMLAPSSPDRSAATRGGPTNDHLPGVSEGAETYLNTREFKYASFFNRVKHAVGSHWRPDDAFRRDNPRRDLNALGERVTVLDVELDGRGALTVVQVAQSSGIGALDTEAVSAFQQAAPFPNPPAGLLEPDGKIRFQFGFYVEARSQRGFQIFRSRQLGE